MVEFLITYQFVLGLVFGLVMLFIGISFGRNYQRRKITKDYDAIIRRLKQHMSNGQYMQLDRFLHELTDDGPYVPSMKVLADNVFERKQQDA